MTTIKVFKVKLDGQLTDAEIRQKYEYFKSKRDVDPHILDNMMKLELTKPLAVQLNENVALQIKNILDWTIPIFDGDPNIKSRVQRDDVTIQSNHEIIGVDRSFQEYMVPRHQSFKVIGLQLSYRRTGGARHIDPWYSSNLELYDRKDVFRMGSWGFLYPGGVFTGTVVCPRPFEKTPPILLSQEPSSPYWTDIAHEINETISWHLRNYSLCCRLVQQLIHRTYPVSKPTPVPVLNQAVVSDRFAKEIYRITKIAIPPFNRIAMLNIVNQLDVINTYQIYSVRGIEVKTVQHGLHMLESRYNIVRDIQQQSKVASLQLFHKAVYDRIASTVYSTDDYDWLSENKKRDVRKRFQALKWVYYVQDDPVAVLLRKMRDAIENYNGDIQAIKGLWKSLQETFDIGTVNPASTRQFYLKKTRSKVPRPSQKLVSKKKVKASKSKRGGKQAPEDDDDSDLVDVQDTEDIEDTDDKDLDEPVDSEIENTVENTAQSDDDYVMVEAATIADAVTEENVDEHIDGPTLCPHYVDHLQQLLAGIDLQPTSEYIVQRWAEKVPIDYRYYCRGCGELLYVDDLGDFNVFGKQQIVTLGNDDRDPLYFRIISETQQALHFIRFYKGRNLKAVQEYIADLLLPEMQAVRTRLQKSKTRSQSESDYIVVIYIFTYVLALFARMIMDSPDRITWAPDVEATIKVHRRGNKEAYHVALSVCYSLVTTAKSSLFSKITDFSRDIITTVLRESFAFANRVQVGDVEQQADAVDIPHAIYMYLSSNTFFDYVYTSYKLLKDPKVRVTDFDKLFGSSYTGTLDRFLQKDWLKTAYCPDTSKPERLTYYEACYAEFMEYVQKELYKDIAVPLSATLNNHFNKWTAVFEPFEKRMYESDILDRLPPKDTFTQHSTAIAPRRVYMNEVRCPDGGKHDYSLNRCTFVYQTSKGKRKLKLDELRRISRADRSHYKLVDQLCARCGQSIHEKPRDSPEIERAIRRSNFFRYYEVRCPVNGWTHEYDNDKEGFVGDSPCKDCGFKQSYLDTIPESYYNKYSKQFDSKVSTMVDITPNLKLYKPPQLSQWKISLAAVMQMSKETTMPYNFWTNVGLTEHLDFETIINGTNNPQSKLSDQQAVGRTLKLSSYIDFIQRSYYMVKNNTKMVVPIGIKTALGNDLGLPGINARMPDILVDYDSQIEYYALEQTPLETSNYALNSMCSILLWIKRLDGLRKLPQKLFAFMVEHIVRSERMVSELSVAKAKTTDNIVVNLDDEEVDAYNESGEQQDITERELNDPFSLEEVDIVTANRGDDDDTIPDED